MHYHIILTELCNSQCRYCYGKSMCEENDLNKRFKFDFEAPYISAVETAKVKAFLSKDSSPVLVFYGGEPLLQIDRVRELIDALCDVPNIQFRMQTNGKLLDKLGVDYLNKIGKILVSVDGTRERTDFNKGVGTYDCVVRNLLRVREEGYKGEVVARMCVSEFPDLYEQVMHLVGLIDGDARVLSHHLPEPRGVSVSEGEVEGETRGDFVTRSREECLQGDTSDGRGVEKGKLFDSIHWQLDAGFYSCDYDYKSVKKFVEEYNASLSKLFDWWMFELRGGRVWKLYPFVGMVEHLLSGRRAKLMCGAGYAGYTITTDGNLVACPIMGCMPDFYCGSLDSSPSELKKIDVSGRCSDCGYLGDCGGRCLYVNKTGLWPPEGMELICSTAKHYINLVRSRIGEIRSLIDGGIVREGDFEYEKYFGPEIVP